jgi:hypothetical protein
LVCGAELSASDVDDALSSIRLMRTINSPLPDSVPDASWQNHCVHSVRGKITLEEWLVNYVVAHIPHHIEQLKRTHADWLARH